MIWGDGTATEAMVHAFEERDHYARSTENGLRFEIYEPGTSRRNLKDRTPLAVLWCPLTPGEPFQWITPELIEGDDPRSVPLVRWADLLPYVCEGSTVTFELAREVINTLCAQPASIGGR